MKILNVDLRSIKRDYERDGFVVIRNYFEESDLRALRDRIAPLIKNLAKKEKVSERYPNILKSLHKNDLWFQSQLDAGKHVELIRDLVGEEIKGISAAFFDRPSGQTDGVEPHLDALGSMKRANTGATLWIALDPARKKNGCVHYLPGSHKQSFPAVIPIPGIDVNSPDIVAAELDPGDVVVHNAHTVHWSGGNASGSPRRAVSYFYFSASA